MQVADFLGDTQLPQLMHAFSRRVADAMSCKSVHGRPRMPQNLAQCLCNLPDSLKLPVLGRLPLHTLMSVAPVALHNPALLAHANQVRNWMKDLLLKDFLLLPSVALFVTLCFLLPSGLPSTLPPNATQTHCHCPKTASARPFWLRMTCRTNTSFLCYAAELNHVLPTIYSVMASRAGGPNYQSQPTVV